MPSVAPLRIGLIHWTFPPTTGGVESHLWDLARFLTEKNCVVTVITGEPTPIESSSWETVSTPLLCLDQIRNRVFEPVPYRNHLCDLLRETILGRGLEVLHGHNLHHFHSEPALALDELRSRHGFKLYHTFHETWPDVLESTPVYRQWDGNFAVSSFVQEQCRELLRFLPQVLRLGIDLERFKVHRTRVNCSIVPTILHPARLLPWKGAHISVEMLARLRDRGLTARLIITDTQQITDWNGELASYRRQILDLISDLRLHNQIEFRSASYSEMPSLYDEADVVIYPTIGEEPYGLVPLEAMASELPVVVSYSGGLPETVVDGQTGFIVEPQNCDSLTGRVATLLTDPRLRHTFGAAGRQRVLQLFDGRRYVRTLLDLYQGQGLETTEK